MERHLDPSYPQRVSSERTHHGQKQRLLQESKERTDQGLQSCEATKLCGGVPVGAMRPITASTSHRLPWLRHAGTQGCTTGACRERQFSLRPLRL